MKFRRTLIDLAILVLAGFMAEWLSELFPAQGNILFFVAGCVAGRAAIDMARLV